MLFRLPSHHYALLSRIPRQSLAKWFGQVVACLTLLFLFVYVAKVITDTPYPTFRTTYPFILPEKNEELRWKTIFPDSLHVYSARISLAFSPLEVHITAISEVRNEWFQRITRCRCEFFDLNRGYLGLSTTAYLTHFYDTHMGDVGVKYSSSRYSCRLPTVASKDFGLRLNCQRSTVSGHVDFYVDALPDDTASRRRNSIVQCQAPLWGEMNEARALVEFVEYYRKMGVSDFIFYVVSVSDDVKKVLEFYRHLGLLTVVSWQVPAKWDELWYNGQMAMINDCLLRTAPYWDFTLNVDFDEFIAITDHDLPGLIDLHPKADCFLFGSSIMKQEEVKECNQKLAASNSLLSTCVNHRQNFVFPLNFRSKYMCRGRTVREHGVHRVYDTRPDSVIHETNPDDALLFHYRATELDGLTASETYEDDWREDNRVKEFSINNSVQENVDKIVKDVFET